MEAEVTVTEVGTLSAGTLLESETVTPPEPAAFERVTVHEVEPPADKLVGTHDSWLIAVEAVRLMLAVWEAPL